MKQAWVAPSGTVIPFQIPDGPRGAMQSGVWESQSQGKLPADCSSSPPRRARKKPSPAAHVLRAQKRQLDLVPLWGARMSRIAGGPRGADIKEVAAVESAMQLRKLASPLPWWGGDLGMAIFHVAIAYISKGSSGGGAVGFARYLDARIRSTRPSIAGTSNGTAMMGRGTWWRVGRSTSPAGPTMPNISG